jgi:hypothetical protein
MPRLNLARSLRYLGRYDDAERYFRQETLPRLGLDEERQARLDRAAAERFAALRAGDLERYRACCLSFEEPGELITLGDTAGAIEMIRDRYRDIPRYDATFVAPLWEPDLDAIRADPRFQDVLEEILAYAGLEGTQLQRAPAGE